MSERDESMSERIARIKGEGDAASPATTGENAGKTTGEVGTEATVNDGTAEGEVVKTTPNGRLAQSNDVIEGNHVGRSAADEGPREVDGSHSPHDKTSDGGSRQQAALTQTSLNRPQQEGPEAREVALDGRTDTPTAGTRDAFRTGRGEA